MASVEDFFSNIPVIGGFFESDEEKNLKKQYADMQAKYQAYRPVAQRARMAGLQNVLDPRMLGPIQAQMAKMYGSGAVPNTAPLLRDPLGEGRLLGEKPSMNELYPGPSGAVAPNRPAYTPGLGGRNPDPRAFFGGVGGSHSASGFGRR